MILPSGAGQILTMRKSGKRPADLVIVSNVGKLPIENPLVVVDGIQEYDWRWIVGLPFILYGTVDLCMLTHLENICETLQGHLPEALLIWDSIKNEGLRVWYLPKAETICLRHSQWEWEFSFQEWSDYENKMFMEMQ